METSQKNEKRNFILIYTACFLMLSLIVFSGFLLRGKSFVSNSDGYSQHLKAMTYYANYLRNAFHGLISNHQLRLPAWDFHIGEGSDVLQSLGYYVVGNPLSLISVFFPQKYMHIWYAASCLVRMYLAGLGFSFLCFYTGKKNQYAILSGALTYTFSYWSLSCATTHFFFLTPLAYFPWILLGIEKILRNESSSFLVRVIFLAALSNFYFFFVLAAITVIYVLERLISDYRKDTARIWNCLKRIICSAILGTCLAGLIIFPNICFYLTAPRSSGVSQLLTLFYSTEYYSSIPGNFISGGDTEYLLIGGWALPLVFLFAMFLQKRENSLLKQLFITCIVILLFPVFGSLLNAGSYATNKWSWAFSLLVAYTLTSVWEQHGDYSPAIRKKLLLLTGIYACVCLISGESRNLRTLIGVGLCFFSIIILRCPGHTRKSLLLTGIVFLEISLSAFWRFSDKGENRLSSMVNTVDLEGNVFENEVKALQNIPENQKSEGFMRYTGTDLTVNAQILASDYYGTGYYWTVSNPDVASFRRALETLSPYDFRYSDYDGRAIPTTLASVGYYIRENGSSSDIPYGFSFDRNIYTNTDDESYGIAYELYTNDHLLSLGYTYPGIIPYENWQKLNSVEKQESLLQGAVLSEQTALKTIQPVFDCQTIPYEIINADESVRISENQFEVSQPNTSVTLGFQGLPECETYIRLTGLDFYGEKLSFPRSLFAGRKDTTYLSFRDSNGASRQFRFHNRYFERYSGRHDYTVCTAYNDQPVQTVTITFNATGVYTYDSMEIICQPMQNYAHRIDDLRENPLTNIELGTDTVSGDIHADRDELLLLTNSVSKRLESARRRYTGQNIQSKSAVFRNHFIARGTPYRAGVPYTFFECRNSCKSHSFDCISFPPGVQKKPKTIAEIFATF